VPFSPPHRPTCPVAIGTRFEAITSTDTHRIAMLATILRFTYPFRCITPKQQSERQLGVDRGLYHLAAGVLWLRGSQWSGYRSVALRRPLRGEQRFERRMTY